MKDNEVKEKTEMPSFVKKREMDPEALLKDKIEVRLIYPEKGQTEMEAIAEEAASFEGGKQAFFVFDKDKKYNLSELMEEKSISGYSVNNPYPSDKADAPVESTVTKADTKPVMPTKPSEADNPDPPMDASSVITIPIPEGMLVDPAVFGEQIAFGELGLYDLMTYDESGVGFYEKTLPGLAGYRMLCETMGTIPDASRGLDLYIQTVMYALKQAMSLKWNTIRYASKTEAGEVAGVPVRWVNNGLAGAIQSTITDLNARENGFYNGMRVSERNAEIARLQHLLTQINTVDPPEPPSYLANREIGVPVMAKKELQILMDECSQITSSEYLSDNVDYWVPVINALATTDRQLDQREVQWRLRQFMYYTRVFPTSQITAEFLEHPKNQPFVWDMIVPQTRALAYSTQFPLESSAAVTTVLARTINAKLTDANYDGQITGSTDVRAAGQLAHDILLCKMERSCFLTSSLSADSGQETRFMTFKTQVLLDCLVKPMFRGPDVCLPEDDVYDNNYMLIWFWRKIQKGKPNAPMDVVGSDTDTFADWLAQQRVDGSDWGRLMAATRAYFGTVNYATLAKQQANNSVQSYPMGMTCALTGAGGRRPREEVLPAPIAEHLPRVERTLLNGNEAKLRGVMLNGQLPTDDLKKPDVEIFRLFYDWTKALQTYLHGNVQMAGQLRLYQKISDVLSELAENRAHGMREFVNRMNYAIYENGLVSFTNPDSVLGALNFAQYSYTPNKLAVAPGSYFSLLALLSNTTTKIVRTPTFESYVNSMKFHSNLLLTLQVYHIIKQKLSTQGLLEAYRTPGANPGTQTVPDSLKKYTGTELTMMAFDMVTSPAVKSIADTMRNDNTVKNFWFPTAAQVGLYGSGIYRKFSKHLSFITNNYRSFGIARHFYLYQQPMNEGLGQPNGGLTGKYGVDAIRQVRGLTTNDNVDAEYDVASWYELMLDPEENALTNLLRTLRGKPGGYKVRINMPIPFKVSEYTPSAADQDTEVSFPIQPIRGLSALTSVHTTNIDVQYWPSLEQTMQISNGNEFAFSKPAMYAVEEKPFVLNAANRFKQMFELYDWRENDGYMTVIKLPEFALSERPQYNYTNGSFT
jgi:hypothetical protein